MGFRIIVSPAKRMLVSGDEPCATQRPRLLGEALVLAGELRSLGRAEAQRIWRCSDRLADEAWARTQALPDELHRDPAALTPAACAYQGIQYTHLAAGVMDTVQLGWLEHHLRILSGLYGILRPLDGVAPYRLEMQAKLPVGGARDLYEFWGGRLYDAIACEPQVTTIVNVASVEYARIIVPHVLPDGPQLLTCFFGTIRPHDGRLLQGSTEAKAARGSLVRWAAERQLGDVRELRSFSERGYAFSPQRSTDDVWVFVRA